MVNSKLVIISLVVLGISCLHIPEVHAVASGIIIPLYIYPGAAWTQVATAKSANPSVSVIAIVNPANGPGSAVNSDYAREIPKLRAAGVIVLGYTTVDYFNAGNHVTADVDKWKAWYTVDGIFIDEMPNSGNHEQQMRDFTAYIKAKGYTMVVGNPGADTAASYVETVDVIMMYEHAGLPTLTQLGGWHTSYNKNNFSIIPYGVTTLDTSFIQSAKNLVGYIYITNDTAPNPWDSLPPYFNNLVSALAGGTTSTAAPVPTAINKVGDVNSDGSINIIDIGIIIDNYGKSGSNNPKADLNHDNIINIVDIGVVIDNYGK